jgi:hypothetical protein
LQALPEKPRLANAANFMPPRGDAFFAVLAHQLAQRVHQLGLQVLEPLVVGSECGRFAAVCVAHPFRGEAFPIRASSSRPPGMRRFRSQLTLLLQG